jgi:hypothetical protein
MTGTRAFAASRKPESPLPATKSRLIPGSHTVRFIAVGLRVARVLRDTKDINVGISCRRCCGSETQHKGYK